MTGDYVSLYINTAFAENDLLPFLSLMFLFMGRILPIIVLVPFFGGKVLPRPAKVAFAISLFAIFLPQLMSVTKTPLAFDLQLVLYLAKEVFVGLLLGFFLSIPFIIVQNAGIMIDHQRGGASLMVNDPTIQNQSSPLGTMFNLVLIYLFFTIDGPFIVLDLLSQSYDIVPPDKMLNTALFEESSQVVQYTTKILGNVMIISTQLAAPALIMILMTDFFLGIANRLAPQVQITFLGMPLKSLLALVIIFFGWRLFNEEIVSQGYKTLNYLFTLIKQFAPTET
jgi:type III secretion protein SpaR/YscT/HrcT